MPNRPTLIGFISWVITKFSDISGISAEGPLFVFSSVLLPIFRSGSGSMPLAVPLQEFRDAPDRFGKIIAVRQKYRAKVVRLRPVEAAALHQQHLLFDQQIQDKLLIVLDRIQLRIKTRK